MSIEIENALTKTKKVRGNLTLLELLGEMVRQFQLTGQIQLKHHELSRRNVERLAKFDNDERFGLSIFSNERGYEIHCTPGYLQFIVNEVLTRNERVQVLGYRGGVLAYVPTKVVVRELTPKYDDVITGRVLLNNTTWHVLNHGNELCFTNPLTHQRHEIRLVPAHLDLNE